MSMGHRGRYTNSLHDVLAVSAQAAVEAQWGEIPGEILSFDAGKQTASIRPLFKPQTQGQAIEPPDLLEVPVRFPRAGGGALTLPVRPGDRVTLRPLMRSGEAYHMGGEFIAEDARVSSLSDMEAYLDGGESVSDPIQSFDGGSVHLRFDEGGQYGLRGAGSGKISITGSQGDIVDLLAQLVELLADDGLDVLYGSSAGQGHQLQHKAAYAEIAGRLRAMTL